MYSLITSMNKKRTIALLTLLLLIVVACTLARTTYLETTPLTPEVVSPAPSPVVVDKNPEPIDVTIEEPEIPEAPIVVTPKPPVVIAPKPNTPNNCFVGGCSGQICSDQPDMISTCEWRESYACFQTAACERQQTGECGWSETPTLRACLIQSESSSTGVY
jgi:eight-cysteine-cluster-containing protein